MSAMKEYIVKRGGVELTMLLTDDDAKASKARPVVTRAPQVPVGAADAEKAKAAAAAEKAAAEKAEAAAKAATPEDKARTPQDK